MADFSIISQSPEIRQLVQENALQRAFHDAMFPNLLFRADAMPQVFPANVGDTQIFTGVGLIPVNLAPLKPGDDPAVSDYSKEQWEATINQYANSIDTPMPSSITAIANLFLRNAQQLGLNAGQTLNRLVRNAGYNASLSGWTVADGAQAAVTTLRVQRLNGFTRARRPDLAAGSPVRYQTVSTDNPLSITILDTTGAPTEVTRTVTGFTPDTAGDEVGPGTLTLAGGAVTVADRAYVFSSDRSSIVRVGGGNQVDDITAPDILQLTDIRSAVARLRNQNVPHFADGCYHAHLDPTSESQIFSDPEFQRLLTSLPDYYMYADFAIGKLLGTVFLRNTECPQVDTVVGGDTATFSQNDPFAGELYNDGTTSGVEIHRVLFSGQGGILEYYLPLDQLITEAGVQGKVGEPQISNNGIEVNVDRVQLIFRSPQNRLQDQVSTSWKFIGTWPVRTDGAVGDAARYKRFLSIEHAG